MQRINAVSLTHNAKDWLTNSHYLRILHIFDNVCNLINERGEILSVVTPQIGNGPFNLVLEKDVLFSGYLRLRVSNTYLPGSTQAWGLDHSDRERKSLVSNS